MGETNEVVTVHDGTAEKTKHIRSTKTRDELNREKDDRRKPNFMKFLRTPGNMRSESDIEEQMEQMRE